MNDRTFRSSISGCFRTFELNVVSGKDYDDVLDKTCQEAKSRILDVLQHHLIKAQLIITLDFHRYVEYGDIRQEKTFRSLCEPILKTDNVDDFLSLAKIYIRHGLETYEKMGSGWIFEGFKSAYIDIAKYSPLSGGVDIPSKVKKMKPVLNVTSSDDKCFLYCLLAKLYPATGKNRDIYLLRKVYW